MKTLQEGEEPLQLKDGWDGKITARGLFLSGEPDLTFALGNHNLDGKGTFSARREGDIIHVEGPVEFLLEDDYNFEEGGSFAKGALELKKYRGARDFKTEAKWRQYFQAKLRIIGGILVPVEFNWKD